MQQIKNYMVSCLFGEQEEEKFFKYIEPRKHLLESYVIKHIPASAIEDWRRKKQTNVATSPIETSPMSSRSNLSKDGKHTVVSSSSSSTSIPIDGTRRELPLRRKPRYWKGFIVDDPIQGTRRQLPRAHRRILPYCGGTTDEEPQPIEGTRRQLPHVQRRMLPYWRGTTDEEPQPIEEAEMSAFLLEVAQAVFEQMVSLDKLIERILEFAQHLVYADRASLFLVDYKKSELVSTVFDLRYESNSGDLSKKEIRIPMDKGIAGHVVVTGETMNIPDAYVDPRFNKAVDEETGYRTVSILCMPIKVRRKIIAVVQMVNKRDGKAFEAEDESAFQVFSTLFGLALHHARLYEKIIRKEQKYKVALEVLSYHNTCEEEEIVQLLEERDRRDKINYNDFELNYFELDIIQKCKGVLEMFDDLFDISKFDATVLARFVLTVKKNYRKVPYHNFTHGWAVANAMYVILKHDVNNRFDYKTRLALFVSCLCHDLDHRGYTNSFMTDTDSPLAAMYTTSTLERHHFNITVTILQQDGHNIFHAMSSIEYKDMLGLIRQCILATDLTTFFPTLTKINNLLDGEHFDWNKESHCSLIRNICMTSADLSAVAKPYRTHLLTVNAIFEEFYLQGDLERRAGRQPIAMMDRNKPQAQPANQVGFLSAICVPCYKVLFKLLPDTDPMLAMTKVNLDIWQSLVQDKNQTDKH